MEISIEVLIADSRLAFVQGRYNESLKLADEALKVDENNSDAHQCAGNAYMSKQDYDNAIEHYKIAVENDADNGDRYFNLGYAYATSNQPVKALEMFAKADEIGCSPNVVGQLYKIMGMLCFDLHRYNDAIINLIKSEKVVGIDMDVLQRKALSYSMSGQTSNGIEVANQMKLLAPTEYLGYRIAFNILLQEERLEEAEKELDRAERFAKPIKELFFDWVAYENARYELDGDKEHLYLAIDKIFEGLCVVEPEVNSIVDSYINAAEIYIQLENSNMALKCINAAENPINSFNEGFSVKQLTELETKPVVKPGQREIDIAVETVRRKYGEQKIERYGREMAAKARRNSPDLEKNMTPIAQNHESDYSKLDVDVNPVYSQEKTEHIYRLYVAAYTIVKDNEHIKVYASKLANSSDPQSKYIGKYSLIKALKDEGYPKADEEYRDFLTYLRNEMIKDPTDLLVLTFRIQCHIDLGEFEEAEKLADLLSDEMRKPILEQIKTAQSGGEA